MIPVKKGLSLLRDEGPTQFLQAVTKWSKNKVDAVIVDYLSSTLYREELRQSADYITEFSKEEQITITPWSNVFLPSDYYTKRIPNERYKFERPFIAEIYDGRILQHNGYCTTEDYDIILDSGKSTGIILSTLSTVDVLKYNIKSNLHNDTQYDFDIVVALTSAIRPSNNSNFINYYTWVHTYLTKLEGINKYIEYTGNEIDILVPANPPSWVLESLDFFGLSDNIVFWDPKDELFVRKLIIPSNRRVEKLPGSTDSKFLSPMACKWLRNEARSRIDLSNTEFSDKIFISRSDAGRRELKNREEILDLLENRGFVSYELTELSFRQQVELFSQANQVIGVHGAGLVNVLFSSECRVIEILGDVLIPTYFSLAQSCELEYQAISGQTIDDPNVSLLHRDIRIDPQKVINCIE